MMKKILFLLCVSLIIGFNNDIKAQDPAFSQFFANPLYLNPAMAGTNIALVLVLIIEQWPGIGKTYVIQCII